MENSFVLQVTWLGSAEEFIPAIAPMVKGRGNNTQQLPVC